MPANLSPYRFDRLSSDPHLLETRLAQYAQTGAFAHSRAWAVETLLREAPPGPVLEVGPGDGADSAALTRAGREVLTLDVRLNFAANTPPGAHAVVGDVAALPVRSARCSAVLANRVLHHVPRLEVALSQLAQALRPGGVLALTLPDHASLAADAPAGPWARFVSLKNTPGLLTARPDAVACVEAHPEWRRLAGMQVPISGEEERVYVRTDHWIEVFAAEGLLDAGDADALRRWRNDGGTVNLNLVGLAIMRDPA